MRSIVPLLFLGFAVATCSAWSASWADAAAKNRVQPRHHDEFVRMLERRRTLLADTTYPQTKVIGDAKSADEFGSSVAMSGKFAVVGAPKHDTENMFDNGAAYLFTRSDTGVETEYIKLRGDSTDDGFGTSVAISGGADAASTKASLTVVVGAPGHDDKGSGAGAAYVYKFSDASQSATKSKLIAPDGEASDGFGTSVATDGDFVVVGANYAGGRGNFVKTSSGAVYIYHRNSSDEWPLESKLFPTAGGFGDEFGKSVSISGNYIVVGAPDHGSGGAVYVYKYNGTEWNLHRKVLAPSVQSSQKFGDSVSISGLLVAVGAPSFDSSERDSAGRAYLFTVDGTLEMTFNAVDGEDYDNFGKSISVSGNFIAISAPGNAGKLLPKSRKLLGSSSRGGVYLFEKLDGGAYKTNKVMANDADDMDYFGSSVAVSGQFFIAGAYEDDTEGDDDNRGSAYISSVHHASSGGNGDCSSCNGANDEVWLASCGALSVKTDKFACDSDVICCAPTGDECCEPNVGAIAGLVIGCIVGLALSITACAWCCKCCCFSRTPAPVAGMMLQQPGMQMATMVTPPNVSTVHAAVAPPMSYPANK